MLQRLEFGGNLQEPCSLGVLTFIDIVDCGVQSARSYESIVVADDTSKSALIDMFAPQQSENPVKEYALVCPEPSWFGEKTMRLPEQSLSSKPKRYNKSASRFAAVFCQVRLESSPTLKIRGSPGSTVSSGRTLVYESVFRKYYFELFSLVAVPYANLLPLPEA